MVDIIKEMISDYKTDEKEQNIESNKNKISQNDKINILKYSVLGLLLGFIFKCTFKDME